MKILLLYVLSPIVLLLGLLLATYLLGKKLLGDIGEEAGAGAATAVGAGVSGIASAASGMASGWFSSLKEAGKRSADVAPKIQRLQEIEAGSLWDQALKGTISDEALQDKLSFIAAMHARVNALHQLTHDQRTRLHSMYTDNRIYQDKETWTVVQYTIAKDLDLLGV